MQAFDGSLATKWLHFSEEDGCAARLEYWLHLQPGAEAATVLRYALTSAKDNAERDPRDWTLEGLPADADDAGMLRDVMRL